MHRSIRATAIQIALAILGICAAIWLASKLFTLIALILVAIVLATGIHPIVGWLQARHFPRWLAILSILLAIIVIALGLFYFVGNSLWNEGHQALKKLPDSSEPVTNWMDGLHERFPQLPSTESLVSSVRDQFDKIGGYLVQTTTTVLGVLGGLGSALTVLVLTFYLLLEEKKLSAAFLALVPPQHQSTVEDTTTEALQTMGGWLRGQTILVGSMLVVITLAMMLLGIPNALLIGVVGALGELVPMVGPIAAAVIAVPVAFLTLPIWVGVVTTVFFVVLSILEGNFIVPKVMEKSVDLSPFFTVIAVIAGATLYGVIGALLAVPLAAAARIYLKRLVIPAIQRKGSRPTPE